MMKPCIPWWNYILFSLDFHHSHSISFLCFFLHLHGSLFTPYLLVFLSLFFHVFVLLVICFQDRKSKVLNIGWSLSLTWLKLWVILINFVFLLFSYLFNLYIWGYVHLRTYYAYLSWFKHSFYAAIVSFQYL